MKKYKSAAEVNEEILSKLEGQDKKAFEQGLKDLKLPGSDLRAAFKRLRPDATEKELDIMINKK